MRADATASHVQTGECAQDGAPTINMIYTPQLALQARCQQQDWPQHKADCKAARAQATGQRAAAAETEAAAPAAVRAAVVEAKAAAAAAAVEAYKVPAVAVTAHVWVAEKAPLLFLLVVVLVLAMLHLLHGSITPAVASAQGSTAA